jgi:hypothetical protein
MPNNSTKENRKDATATKNLKLLLLFDKKIETRIKGGIRTQKVNKSMSPIIINADVKLRKKGVRFNFNSFGFSRK